ncbi:MAG: hypothetical protein E6J19_09210 [Chloroflexi bacterium]|nr:MAG: hypothetical protein E6J19_09210 [Chloroflexota bacterium]
MTFEREVCYLTAAELSEGYRRKRFTALEVTEALLRRIERLDGGLRAYITVTADHARAQAKAADAALSQSDPRPLLGVPLALKDLFATKGIRTTAGSKVFWDRVPTEDATCVARLRSAGTVLLGKLTMHELAYGWPTEEGQLATGRNPWDTTRIPAGSSSGCGVAVAAGLATITLGSDTGGSIRGPANNCGIVGLKPTYGRVSVRGAAPLSWSLDHMGPLCRTVEDVALTLAAIAGVDRRDPTSSTRRVPDYRAALEADVKGVRVGVPGESLYREHALDGEIRSALEAAAGVLRGSGAIVRRVEMPKPARWQAIVNVILSEAYEYHAHPRPTPAASHRRGDARALPSDRRDPHARGVLPPDHVRRISCGARRRRATAEPALDLEPRGLSLAGHAVWIQSRRSPDRDAAGRPRIRRAAAAARRRGVRAIDGLARSASAAR